MWSEVSAQPEETQLLWNTQSGTDGFYPWPWVRLAPSHLTFQRRLSALPAAWRWHCLLSSSRESSPSFFLTSMPVVGIFPPFLWRSQR